MRHVRLISYEDEPTGSLGLIVKGSAGPEIFADTDGRLLAHDLVEHQNGPEAIGRVDDELEAIGAIWQVRGRHGDMVESDLYRYGWRCPYETIAGDVLTCASDLDTSEAWDRWEPHLGRYRTRRHDYDEDFMEVLSKARPMVQRELEHNEAHFPMEAFFDNALHLMRSGFNKAKRRFGMGYQGIDTYRAIMEAVRPNAKHLDGPGQEFILAYGDGEARCYEAPFPRDAW